MGRWTAAVLAATLLYGTHAASAANHENTPALKQFTSKGHVLGFDSQGYYVSNGTYALRVRFEGAQPVEAIADDAASDGNDPKALPLSRVDYPEVWPGISVAYDASGNGIVRSTWTIQPGADPSAIRLHYNQAVSMAEDGSLGVGFETGNMSESHPLAWQDVDGRRQPVEVAFAKLDDDSVGFRLGAYRRDVTLTIDPILTWHTFLSRAGSVSDFGNAITVDSSGNVYVVGSSDGPWGTPISACSGQNDAYVAKLSAAGTLTWNTFLGGSNVDRGNAIEVDGSGNVYVAGYSQATWGNPVRAFSSAGYDAFAAQLSPTGVLTWNTFLGDGYGVSEAYDIAVDGSGNVYVAGQSDATWGSPVRAFSGFRDAFAAQLSAGGALMWNTFLGGSSEDHGSAITIDGSSNIYVAGFSAGTWGSPVDAYNVGGRDAFVAQLNSGGALMWNTFLGGGGEDLASAVAVDSSGNVYVAGYSNATWGISVRAYSASDDMFAAKLSAAGVLTWNTFLGGSGSDVGSAIALDGSGNVHVAGFSTDTWGSPALAYTGGTDTVVAHLSPSGALMWNTFLGGSAHDAGSAVALDGSGNVYVAGFSAAMWGSPVRAYSGGADAFAVRLNSAGVLTWNTFLGGGGSSDEGYAIAVDGSGNVYVSGLTTATWGSPMRAYSGSHDAFAVKLGPGGALAWNTFLGGGGSDWGSAIAVDDSGNVYVAGYSDTTWGSPVRAYSGGADAFAVRLNSAGVLTWNTFLGGGGADWGSGIAVDANGNVALVGSGDATWGTPVRAHGGDYDAFAAQLSAAGVLTWNSFLGGSGADFGNAIALDGGGNNVHVAGYSDTTWGSPVRAFSGSIDAFAAQLTSAGMLTWNSFVGGAGSDLGKAIALDGSGNVYVAGWSGATWGSPVRAYSGGDSDAFAAKLSAAGTLTWNTFLGGALRLDGGSAQTEGQGIAIDGSGNVYVAGFSTATWGTPVRAFGGGSISDAFAAQLSPGGVLKWNTFLGGGGEDYGAAIAVDGSDNVYAAGYSNAAWGTPVQAYGGAVDAFAAMIGYTPPVCGNTVPEGLGEQCDDGNIVDGDCCSSTCQYEMTGSVCISDNNSCTPDTCNGAGVCVHGDDDGDGIGDLCDNCAVIFNPDQSNSDCAAANSGCTDGGDTCDPCPADKNNQCNAAGSTGGSVDSSGGTFSSPDGSVAIDVPPGAVSGDTTITATDGGPPQSATAFRLGNVLVIQARPENQIFDQPVSITFTWDDRDGSTTNDPTGDRVDTGFCVGGSDDGLSCDENGDCTSGDCTVNVSNLLETNLVLRRNGTRFGLNGFAVDYECSDHQTGSGCESAVADCNDDPGMDKATVAQCCDMANNTWAFQTCSFSEFTLGVDEFDNTESVDGYLTYKIKASDGEASFPSAWNIQLEDAILPDTEPDNPENYIVKKESALANPAALDAQATPNETALHYLRYQIKGAKEGAGAQLGDGSFPKAVKAPVRLWELNNALGSVVVESKKITHLWVPAGKDLTMTPADPGDRTHYLCYQVKAVKGVAAGQSPGTCDSASPANARGPCENEMDCGGTAGVTELCEKPKFAKSNQAYAADQFDDCATFEDSANVPFSGTGVEAKCLVDLKKPKALCNPAVKSVVGAGRETAATITGSTPSTTTSLLCYQSKAASKFANDNSAAFANQTAGTVLTEKQSKHVPRLNVNTKPGNQFPAPLHVDTSKQELLCLPTQVLSVSNAAP